ncbi:Lipoamide acyltransferase component of branched-chain alpha-keto acid dehydrogenase complex [Bacillus thuringiensis serovar israelensis ATCC 35646]|nr:Lipoamide acyltransferase component of branched-chain alpha-keto acid dehydrogenase complex [Bacillus thuringiensis serovar israelensis ATCC 35646]
MTDKVNAEVPSSFTGIVKELIAGEGDTLAVGEVVCVIQVEGADEVAATAVEEKTKEEPKAAAITPEKAPKVKQPTDGKPRFSPAVLKLAGEHNVDLDLVEGTGANGRITRKDILKLVESGNIPQAGAKKEEAVAVVVEARPVAQKVEAAKPVSVPTMPGDIEIPVTGVRKAIAANMLRSKHEAPHAWMMIEVDVTNLVSYRNSIKGDFKKREGFNLTFFAFFVKAVAQALKEYPQINSMWAGDKIVQKKDINLSIAVATEEELFVPVIKQADEKTLRYRS